MHERACEYAYSIILHLPKHTLKCIATFRVGTCTSPHTCTYTHTASILGLLNSFAKTIEAQIEAPPTSTTKARTRISTIERCERRRKELAECNLNIRLRTHDDRKKFSCDCTAILWRRCTGRVGRGRSIDRETMEFEIKEFEVAHMVSLEMDRLNTQRKMCIRLEWERGDAQSIRL